MEKFNLVCWEYPVNYISGWESSIAGQNQEYYIPRLYLLAFDNTSFVHNFMRRQNEAESSCCLLKCIHHGWRSSKKQPFMVMMSDLFQVDLTGLLWGHCSHFRSPIVYRRSGYRSGCLRFHLPHG